LYGRGYVIDHCIASMRTRYKEKAYKTYITDVLKLITEMYSTAHGGNLTLPRYVDIEKPQEDEEDEATAIEKAKEEAEEIKTRIFTKLKALGE